MKKTIYLAGGCFWGCQKYFDRLPGVVETQVGYANGHTVAPTYEQVKHENTGHAETVRVVYDDAVLPLRDLLSAYGRVIDPTTKDRQGGDVGHQYRTGIYYEEEADGESSPGLFKGPGRPVRPAHRGGGGKAHSVFPGGGISPEISGEKPRRLLPHPF